MLFTHRFHPNDGIVFDRCIQQSIDASIEDIEGLGIGGTRVVGAVRIQRPCLGSDEWAAEELCILEVILKAAQLLVPYRLVWMHWIDVASKYTDVCTFGLQGIADRDNESLGICTCIGGVAEDFLEGELDGNRAPILADFRGKFFNGVECAQIMGSKS